MTVLGICAQHDSGAALLVNGRLVAAVNEERLNREKLFWGWPERSIPEVLRIAGVDPEDVDCVAVSNATHSAYAAAHWEGIYPREFKRRALIAMSRLGLARAVGGTQAGIHAYRFLNGKALRRSATRALEERIRDLGMRCPVVHIDHHQAHLASAYYTSGWDDCLNISIDGVGDGYCSRIAICRDGRTDLVHRVPFYHTPGQYYGFVTGWAGFTPGKHEGKITGLAAHGDPMSVLPLLQSRIGYSEKDFSFVNFGRWARAQYEYLAPRLDRFSKEDVAAAIQVHLEDLVTQYVAQAIRTYGPNKVVLSGGIFANVKLNQRVLQIEGVRDIFVHPNMDGAGLAAGSAFAVAASRQGLRPVRLGNAYLGTEITDAEIQTAISTSGFPFTREEDVETAIAAHLAAGKVVARVNGRMEYGPRALGNRSILYQATDVTVNKWLNKRLKRTEFMPFAPSILKECAGDYYHDFPRGEHAAEFMTVTYDVTDRCVNEAPAVVHVDRTARPQVVTEGSNPSFYRVLKQYKALTGFPQVINTSFNMHEEPIVCSAQDAVRAFDQGDLDILAIGDYIVENVSLRSREIAAETEAD